MKKFIFFLFVFNVVFLYSQDKFGAITGKVVDVYTKQGLPGINVTILDTQLGASTDVNGEFRILNVPIGVYRLRASSIGYNPVIKTDIIVKTVKATVVDFELQEKTLELEGITASIGYFQKDPYEITSVTNLSFEEIRRAPGGLEDVVRAISVLPGVAQADAGRNDLIVRGGAPSENLYLVDGIPVPNINHFGTQGATGGPLSFINLDFVKSTSFSTGGFSSMHGDKLSSVLEINLRDGRKDRFGGKATISATQFGLNVEGPIGEKGDIIFSARRSYLDFIFKAAGFGFVPEYYDVLAKANYSIDSKNSLSYLFISAFDNVKYFNDTEDQRYNNARALGSDQQQYVTGLSWKSLFDKGYFVINLSRNYISFNTIQRDTLLNPIFKNESLESENNLKADLIYKLGSNSELGIGTSTKLIKFKSDLKLPNFITTFGDTLNITSLNKKDNYYKADVYIQYSNLLFDRLRVNVGLRLDYFNAINVKTYISPRVSLSYMFNDITSINFATGIYRQSPSYIWLIADESNKGLKNIRVDQYILGVDHRVRYDVIAKVEGFYKDYKDYPASLLRKYLVLANTGAGFAGAEDNFSSFGLEPLVSAGKGFSRGVEVSLQKKSSDIPHYGLFSLTYSESRFKALDGIERRGSYEQNWIINLSAGYIFNNKWEGSLKFRFATGKPYTPYNSDGTQDVDKYNSSRVVANHSLDLRVDRKWDFGGYNLIAYLDVQNIYNRKNTSFVRWDKRERKVDMTSSIGILPSIGVSLEM